MPFDQSDKEWMQLTMKNAAYEAMDRHRKEEHVPLENEMRSADSNLGHAIGRVRGKIQWLWGAMAGITVICLVVAWIITTGMQAKQTAMEMRSSSQGSAVQPR